MKRFNVKKIILEIFAVLFLSVLPWSSIFAASTLIAVSVDGQPIVFDQPPVMSQGRVMVPLRGVFEKLGATVNYDAASQNVTARRGTTLISLSANSSEAQVNGVTRTMDSPPIMMGSRVLVPLRFVSEALGADVKWQAYNSSVTILSKTGGVDLPYAPAQTSGPFQLSLTSPAPASAVPGLFDVTGTTQPYATVSISVTSDMPRHGFLGMSGPTNVNVLNTATQADSSGNYTFHVNASDLATGAHIVVNLSASNSSGSSSNQQQVQYSRQ